jgi:hypothetical protein
MARLVGVSSKTKQGLAKLLSSRKLDLLQGCHEIAEKSSKIVPLGAVIAESAPFHACHALQGNG